MVQSTGELQRENVRLTNDLAESRRQLERAEQIIQDKQAQIGRAREERDAYRVDVRALEIRNAAQALEIRGYIEQDVLAGGKYRTRLEAATQELRMVTKAGLTSGCGCPIGQCLKWGGDSRMGACWAEWAEAYVMKRQGEIRIDVIRTQANHPARIAAADRQRRETEGGEQT